MSTSTTDRFAYLDAPDPFADVGLKVAPKRPTQSPVKVAEQPGPPAPVRTVSVAPAPAPRGAVVPSTELVLDETLEPLVAYDQAKREQAEQHGEPTDRSTTPSVLPGLVDEETGPITPLVYMWIDEDSDRILHVTDTAPGIGGGAPVNAGVLADLIDAGHRLVMPDDLVATRLLRACSAAARSNDPAKADLAARVVHQLGVMSHLSWSSFFIVLTRALARRFWLPASLDVEDALAWADAFGLDADRMDHATMRRLVDLASDGVIADSAAKNILYPERSAITSSAYPGLRSSVMAFQAVNRAESAMKAATLTDPMLFERHVLTGDVCRLGVLSLGERQFVATASQPFKMRAGKDHVLTTGKAEESNSYVVLESVQAHGSTLVATVCAPASRNSSSRRTVREHPSTPMARAAMNGAYDLFLYEKPFSARPPSSDAGESAGRWSTGHAVEPISPKWAMPSAIASAGGPVAG